MNALGTHLLLDLKDCNVERLNDLHFIKQAMIGAADEVGVTIVGESFHKFDPVGVTGIISITESHLCIHTWPEHGYAAVDIFTCGSEFKPREAAESIIRSLQCANPDITEIKRGLVSEPTTLPV